MWIELVIFYLTHGNKNEIRNNKLYIDKNFAVNNSTGVSDL